MQMVRLERMKAIEDRSIQRFPVIGMRDLDEFGRTLTQILAIQIRNAVLRDDVVNVGSSSDHACTFF